MRIWLLALLFFVSCVSRRPLGSFQVLMGEKLKMIKLLKIKNILKKKFVRVSKIKNSGKNKAEIIYDEDKMVIESISCVVLNKKTGLYKIVWP